MPVAACLADKDDLVNSGSLVLAEQRPELFRRSDGPAQRQQALTDRGRRTCQPGPQLDVGLRCCLTVEAEGAAVLLELSPDVGDTGAVAAEGVEVSQGVAKEVGAVDTPVDGGRLVLVAHHRQYARDVGVHREAGGDTLLGCDGGVVLGDPVLRFTWLDEGEGEGTDPLAGGQLDGLTLAAGHPEGRMGLLVGLWHDVAWRHLQPGSVPSGEWLLDHHPGCGLDVVEPLLPLGFALGAEAIQLGGGRGLTCTEVHPTVRQQVQGVDPFDDPGRVVVLGGQQHDAVPEPDARRALTGCSQEDLGGGTVAVLLQEVVLHLPDTVEAQPVGQLHLIQCILEELVLVAIGPGAGKLVFIEDPELHVGTIRATPGEFSVRRVAAVG